MFEYAWIILALPAAAVLINLFFGKWLSDRLSPRWRRRHRPRLPGSRTGSSTLNSVCSPKNAKSPSPCGNGLPSAPSRSRCRHAARPAEPDRGPHGHRRRHPNPCLFHRLHARGRTLPALLPLHELLCARHARPRLHRQLRDDVRRLGRRRTGLVPAHRLLV